MIFRKFYSHLLILISLFFVFCSKKSYEDQIEEIEVIRGHAQTFYVKSKTYVVQYTNGKSDSIDFNLYNNQIGELVDSYYENEIFDLGESINLHDIPKGGSIIMPASETLYIIHFKNGNKQKIHLKIFSEPSPLEMNKNRRIAEFLIPLNELLDSVKRAKNLPITDFLHI